MPLSLIIVRTGTVFEMRSQTERALCQCWLPSTHSNNGEDKDNGHLLRLCVRHYTWQ